MIALSLVRKSQRLKGITLLPSMASTTTDRPTQAGDMY